MPRECGCCWYILAINNTTHSQTTDVTVHATLVSDTFSRPDGALGYTESYPLMEWIGSTWSISGSKVIDTPVTFGSEQLGDPGLERTYTDGLIYQFEKYGTPIVSQSADVHSGSKAQAFQADAQWEKIGVYGFTSNGFHKISSWIKR